MKYFTQSTISNVAHPINIAVVVLTLKRNIGFVLTFCFMGFLATLVLPGGRRLVVTFGIMV